MIGNQIPEKASKRGRRKHPLPAAPLKDQLSLLEAIFDHSPVAIAITRLRDNRLVNVNAAWEQITGFARQEVIQRKPLELDAWEDPDQWKEMVGRLLEEGLINAFECRIRHESGRRVDLLMSARRIEQSGESYILSMAQDITARKKLEKVAGENERRYAMTERIAHVGHWERDFNEDTSHWSPEMYRIFGLDPKHPPPTFPAFLEMVHLEDRPLLMREIQRGRSDMVASQIEYRIRRPDGQLRRVRSFMVPTTPENGRIKLLGAMIDITDAYEARQRLEAVVRSEREAVRRDLHDSVCQQLSAMAFLLDRVLSDAAISRSQSIKDIERVLQLTHATIEQARSIAHGLAPLADQPDALFQGLLQLAHYVTQIYKMPCRFISRTIVAVNDPTVATQLLLIAREAAVNAGKHSRARRINISLSKRGNTLCLRVRDDGQGLKPGGTSPNGQGLRLMRERAAIIGADLTIAAHPQKGTEVACRLKI